MSKTFRKNCLVCTSEKETLYKHTVTDRQSDRQSDRQTDSQTDSQFGRQIDRQTDRQIEYLLENVRNYV